MSSHKIRIRILPPYKTTIVTHFQYLKNYFKDYQLLMMDISAEGQPLTTNSR